MNRRGCNNVNIVIYILYGSLKNIYILGYLIRLLGLNLVVVRKFISHTISMNKRNDYIKISIKYEEKMNKYIA